MSKGKTVAVRVLGVSLFLVLIALGLGLGVVLRVLHRAPGEHTGAGGGGGLWQGVRDAGQVALEPKEGFPGRDRLVILCMGIDDNWTDRDEVYTAGARTDTLFLLSLDLAGRKAAMLSIPRDTYAHIAGTPGRYFKINEAYSTGGPERSIATVDELLGVHADHYLVLNIDATKKMVDALGGVDVNVEHEMHRHDHWGHFAVDLLPGVQHLDGNQAVGFARYREPDAGHRPTPEDGDIRRAYRQHILLRAMIGRAKSFASVAQAPRLIDTAMSTIRTDLTRTQLYDLAAIYRDIQPEGIKTATLPGDDFQDAKGIWFYRLDMPKARAYTDWLVRGDETAARRLVPVVVTNGTAKAGLAQRVVGVLRANGYTDVRNGGNAADSQVQMTAMHGAVGAGAKAGGAVARTQFLDTGVADPQASADIAAMLGLSGAQTVRRPLQPNQVGWTPPAVLTLTLGQDYAWAVTQADKAAGALPAQPDIPTVKQD